MSMRHFLSNLAKYIVEGLVVAVVAYYIPKRSTDLKTVALIGVIAALTFALLDYFSPSIGASSRLGAGFGIGSRLVGFGGGEPLISTASLPQLPGSVSNVVPALEGFYSEQKPNQQVVTDVMGNQVVVNAVPVNAAGSEYVYATPVTTVQTSGYVPAYETAQYGTGYPAPQPNQLTNSIIAQTDL